jgi:PhnB protein
MTEPRRRGRPPSGGREAILDATLALLRERGVARLTTRDVAERAGVSEASVYYHYTDKAGLLRAVFEAGLPPLEAFEEVGDTPLLTLGQALERFLDQALPVMMAAQSDVSLREEMAAFLAANDLGPHRGVRALAPRLPDPDPEAAALLFTASCFMRAAQRQIMGKSNVPLPSLERSVAVFERLLGMGAQVVPQLSVRRGAEAVEFYKAAFGAVVVFCFGDEEVVAQLEVEGSPFWVESESPEHGNFSPETVGGATTRMLLRVEDPEAMVARALAAGAREVHPVEDAHGWRYGRVEDPFGHHWEIGKPLVPWPPK